MAETIRFRACSKNAKFGDIAELSGKPGPHAGTISILHGDVAEVLVDVQDVRVVKLADGLDIHASVHCPLIREEAIRWRVEQRREAVSYWLGETRADTIFGSEFPEAWIEVGSTASGVGDERWELIDARPSDVLRSIVPGLPIAKQQQRQPSDSKPCTNFRKVWVTCREADSRPVQLRVRSLLFARRHWEPKASGWLEVDCGGTFGKLQTNGWDAIDVAMHMGPSRNDADAQCVRWRAEIEFCAAVRSVQDTWNRHVAKPVALAARVDGQGRSFTFVPWIDAANDKTRVWWCLYAWYERTADAKLEPKQRTLSVAADQTCIAGERPGNVLLTRPYGLEAWNGRNSRGPGAPSEDPQATEATLVFELPGVIATDDQCVRVEAQLTGVDPARVWWPGEFAAERRVASRPDPLIRPRPEYKPPVKLVDTQEDVVTLAMPDGLVVHWDNLQLRKGQSAQLRIGSMQFDLKESQTTIRGWVAGGLGTRREGNPRGEMFNERLDIPTILVAGELMCGHPRPAGVTAADAPGGESANDSTPNGSILILPSPISPSQDRDARPLRFVEYTSEMSGQQMELSWDSEQRVENGTSTGDGTHERSRPAGLSLLLRSHPFTVIGVPPLQNAKVSFAGDSWTVENANITKYALPPQVMGESAESGNEGLEGAFRDEFKENELATFRFPPITMLEIAQTIGLKGAGYAPWEIDRVFGGSEAETVSPTMIQLQTELFYGLAVRARTLGIRVRELFARAGRLVEPSSTEDGYGYGMRWRALAGVVSSRPHALELFEERKASRMLMDKDGRVPPIPDVVLRDDVSWQIRLQPKAFDPTATKEELSELLSYWDAQYEPASIADQFAKSNSDPRRPAGVTSGVVSEAIRTALLENPESRVGALRNVRLTPLGGDGETRVIFNDGTVIIEELTEGGRVSGFAVSLVGRIGVFWNEARHVTIYERTGLPSEQMEAEQNPHFGRMILRRTQEFVEITQPVRKFPDDGQTSTLNVGCLREMRFGDTKVVRIPVSHWWGSEVRESGAAGPTGKVLGWQIPLWDPGADADIYPKPGFRVRLSIDENDRYADCTILNPQNLRFWMLLKSDAPTGDDGIAQTDKWPAELHIDRGVDVRSAKNESDPLQVLADPPDIDPLLERFTFELACTEDVNIASGRQRGSCLTKPRRIVVMREMGVVNLSAPQAAAQVALVNVRVAAARTLAPRSTGILKSLREGLDDIDGKIDQAESGAKELVQKLNAWIDSRGVELAQVQAGLAGQGSALGDLSKHLPQWQDDCAAAIKSAKAWMSDATLAVEQFQCDPNLKGDAAVQFVQAQLLPLFADLTSKVRSVELQAAGVTERTHGALVVVQRSLETTKDELATLQHAVKSRLDAIVKDCTSLGATRVELIRGRVLEYVRYLDDAIEDVRESVERSRRAIGERSAIVGYFGQQLLAALAGHIDELIDAMLKVQRSLVQKAGAADSTLDVLVTAITDASNSWQTAMQKLWSGLHDAITNVAQFAELLVGVADKMVSKFEDATQRIVRRMNNLPRVISEEIAKAIQDAVKLSGATVTCDAIKQRIKGVLNELQTLVGSWLTKDEKLDAEFVRKLKAGLEAALGVANLKLIEDNFGKEFKNVVEETRKLAKDKLDKLKTELGNWKIGPLPSAVADSAKEAGKALEVAGHLIAVPLRSAVQEAVSSLDPGAVVAQVPEKALALIGAFGPPPRVPQMSFDAKAIAFSLLPGQSAIDFTPVKAYVGEVEKRLRAIDNGMRALGLEIDTRSFAERFAPLVNEANRLADVIRNLGGMRLAGLFPGLKMDKDLGDNIKIDQQLDLANRTGSVKADVLLDVGDQTMIDAGPLVVRLNKARFEAHVRMKLDASGRTTREATGSIEGTWALEVGGKDLVRFPGTRVTFSEPGGMKFDMSLERMELSGVLKMISDSAQISSGDDEKSGLSVRTLERDGIVSGVVARLLLKVPNSANGPSGISNLTLGASLGLMLDRGQNGMEFTIAVGFNISSREKPFNIAIFFLGGAGYLEVATRYNPIAKRLQTSVDLGIYASASVSLSLGVVEGSVSAYLGITGRYLSSSGQAGQLSITIVFIIRGEVKVLGFIRVSLMLMLELGYEQLPGKRVLYGRGTIEIRVKIGWFINIRVRKSIEYRKVSSTGNSSRVFSNDNPLQIA